MVTTGGLGDLGFSEGDTASSGSSVISPVSSTSLTVVMLLFAKYYARIAINLHRNERGVLVGAVDCARVAERDAAESVAENEVMVEIGFTSSAW